MHRQQQTRTARVGTHFRLASAGVQHTEPMYFHVLLTVGQNLKNKKLTSFKKLERKGITSQFQPTGLSFGSFNNITEVFWRVGGRQNGVAVETECVCNECRGARR
jgi:hypothetical protein